MSWERRLTSFNVMLKPITNAEGTFTLADYARQVEDVTDSLCDEAYLANLLRKTNAAREISPGVWTALLFP